MEENKETKGGTTREGDIPVHAFTCEATGRELEAVNAEPQRKPLAVKPRHLLRTKFDAGHFCPSVSCD